MIYVLADFDEDGVFDESDLISSHVAAIKMSRRVDPLTRMSTAFATIRVKNTGNQFSLETGSAIALRVGLWIRIKYGATPIFTGVLTAIEHLSLMSASLIVEGRLGLVNGAAELPLQQSEGSGALVTRALRAGQLPEPRRYTDGQYYAFINDPDVLIDAARVYPDTILAATIESGTATMVLGRGDEDVRDLLRRAMRAEWGWLIERADQIAMRGRYWTILNNTSAGTFADASAVNYTHAAGYTRVRAQVVERSVSNEQVWGVGERILIRSGENTLRVRAQVDERKALVERVTAQSLSFEDAQGNPRTNALYVAVDARSDLLLIGIRNDGAHCYLTAGAIQADCYLEAAETEVFSERMQRPVSERELDLGLLDIDTDAAQHLTQYLQASNYERSDVRWIETYNAGWAALDLLDLVTITLSSWQHTGEYRVIGVEMEQEQGKGRWRYYLHPADNADYIVINETGRNLIDTGWIV